MTMKKRYEKTTMTIWEDRDTEIDLAYRAGVAAGESTPPYDNFPTDLSEAAAFCKAYTDEMQQALTTHPDMAIMAFSRACVDYAFNDPRWLLAYDEYYSVALGDAEPEEIQDELKRISALRK